MANSRELTEKFINDANEISGDIVLRAAKSGRNARELMGVVLEPVHDPPRNGRRATVRLVFSGRLRRVARATRGANRRHSCPGTGADRGRETSTCGDIAESKYIDVANLAPKRKESQKQLRDTVRRINDAIFGDPKRLDRDLWFSRFSDLMLNGIQFPANSQLICSMA